MALTTDDIVQIQQLYAAYNFAVDDGDGKAFAAVFTADGTLLAGPDPVSGSEALSTFAAGVGGSGMRHIANNIVLEGDGNTARGRAYLQLVRSGDGGTMLAMTGRYEDELVKGPDGWAFSERRFTPDG